MWEVRRRSARSVPMRLLALGGAAVLALGVAACGGDDGGGGGGGGGSAAGDQERVTVGLIVKRESNPFFVKMIDAAKKAASENNVELLTAAGKTDVDNQSQVTALENMTTRGAKGILIVPADSKAVVPAIKKA
ncbi:MAG: fructose transport system substrate-binding protein, partial [Solirubrobacteraceae bacterium]|nr:fructose transport system substrate-binding protein [Solirubrobacteraceae bacterium]